MEFFGCLGIIAIFLAVWGLETWVIMALWNWLAVSLFGAPEITFWMTAGLMLLVNLLTGGIRSIAITSKKFAQGVDKPQPLCYN